ncbi:MAG TPA: MFS transporter [Gaiellaceae bacterium]|nr:MFS transporter [Gaiellaceae bacterium]
MPRNGVSLLRVRGLFTLFGVSESAFVPFLPLLLTDRGLSPQAVGAALAVMSAVAFAVAPPWGYLADRVIGRERTLAICLIGTVGGSLLLSFAHGAVALSVAGSVVFLFRAPNNALADALALDRLGPDRRSAYGGVRLWMSASFAVGAIVWGGVMEAFGIGLMAPLYAACTGLNALLVVGVFRGRWPRPLRTGTSTRALGAVLASPAVVLFLLALFLSFAPYAAAYNFAAVRIAALGGGAVLVGLAAGLQAAAEVPSMMATVRLARRVRPAGVFATGAALSVIVYAIWAVVGNPAALATARIVAGLGFGLTSVAMVVITDELVPAGLRATGQAASKAVAMGLAPVLGVLGGGIVYGYAGPAALFVVAGVMTAFSALAARSAAAARLRPVEHA